MFRALAGGVAAVALTVAAFAQGSGSSRCGPPAVNGSSITFGTFVSFISNCSFPPEIRVRQEVGELAIFAVDRCTGLAYDLFEMSPKDQQGLKDALGILCTESWVQKYGPFGGSSSQVPLRTAYAAATLPSSGQASGQTVAADFNGDGVIDLATLGAAGVSVKLMAADGSVRSTNQFAVGFGAKTGFSHIIAADFNGDGKLDLAVSNLGSIGSDNGGVAIIMGNGDGTFRSPNYLGAGLNPLAMAAADFNGDGKVDLAVANQWSGVLSSGVVVLGPGTVSVLTGNGDGTFQAPVAYPTGEDTQGVPVSLAALDLNGDGLPDLAVANRNDKSISTLLNKAGKLQAPVVAPAPYDPQYLAFADLNGDGKPDLVAAAPGANATMVLSGNGDGTFQAPAVYATGSGAASIGIAPLGDGNTLLIAGDGISSALWVTVVSPKGVVGAPPLYPVGGQPTGIAAGDLNGDGLPDAVVTGGASDVAVLLGQPGNQFKAPVGYSLTGANPQAALIGDFNNDGKPDVLTVNGRAGQPATVTVQLGNGDGTLQAPLSSTMISQAPHNAAIADFNGDRKLDVAVANTGSADGSDPGGVAILTGRGDGTFQSVPQLLTVSGLHPLAVAAGDLNGDGFADIAALEAGATGQPAALAVFLNQGNGVFQIPRVFALKAASGTAGAVVIGDLNGDGKPDIAAAGNFGSFVDILLGDGAGGFQEAAQLPQTGESGGGALVLADVDGDGRLDLVIAHCCGAADGTFLLGNGNGTFQAEQQFLSGSSPVSVAAVKFSGAPGLISADQSGTVAATAFVLPAALTLTIQNNVSAANTGLALLSPASYASAFGTNLATMTAQAGSGALPLVLGGTTVNIHDAAGVDRAAPLSYVSAQQVNYEVPAGTALGKATITIHSASGLSGSTATTIASIAPGVFPLNAGGLAAAVVLVVHQDGSQTFANVYQLNASNNVVALPVDLSIGQVYLELYGTGIRNAKAVSVSVAGGSVPIYSFGPQGFYDGLDQINIGPLPVSLQARGQVNLVLTADGQVANTVNLVFK